MLIWLLASHLHTSLNFFQSQRMTTLRTMWGFWPTGGEVFWHVNPNSCVMSIELKAPGPGSDPWQSWRVAATLGPLQHGLLGAHCATFQPQVLLKHFLPKPSPTSVSPNMSKRARGLKRCIKRGLPETFSSWPQLKWLHCKEDIWSRSQKIVEEEVMLLSEAMKLYSYCLLVLYI